MKARALMIAFGVVLAGAIIAHLYAAGESGTPGNKAGEYMLSGPFTHDNLTVYLIHGPDKLKDKHYLTLQEGLERKIIVIHETGNVNELQVENVSPDQDVYIQSGDIVKGGRQDRTIALDFICPPKSGLMGINAFCVEHGRWSGRGAESDAYFASSANSVSGNALKFAAKGAGSQQQVWREVGENQTKLTMNAGSSVLDPKSATSFELTLENAKVKERSEGYAKELRDVVNGKADVIGYATAINGKVNCADVYASHELFVKLWPKLLDSAAVEAFAEIQKDKKFEPATVQAFVAAIEAGDKGGVSTRDVTPRVQMITRDAKTCVLFETRDSAAPSAAWVHRNYLTKDADSARPAPSPAQLEPQLLRGSNPINNAPSPTPQPAQPQQ